MVKKGKVMVSHQVNYHHCKLGLLITSHSRDTIQCELSLLWLGFPVPSWITFFIELTLALGKGSLHRASINFPVSLLV